MHAQLAVTKIRFVSVKEGDDYEQLLLLLVCFRNIYLIDDPIVF